MDDELQGPEIRLFDRAARLGHRLLIGDADPLSGDEDFLLLGMDADAGVGIGVVWLVHGEWSFRCDYEQDALGVWHHLGGGCGSVSPEMLGPRPSAAGIGTPLLTAVGGVGFTRGRRFGFVASFSLRAADVVDHVVVEGRDIAVPDHGLLVVVWNATSAQFGPIARPPVVAFDELGRELAVLEPLSPFDDVTMRVLTATTL